MKRRDILKASTLVLGYSIIGGSALSVMSGCKADTSDNWIPSFLTEKELSLATSLADLIIPRTDTPSASEALVHRYIDASMFNNHTIEEQQEFKAALNKFNVDCFDKTGIYFVDLNLKDQNQELKNLANNMKNGEFSLFRKMKELTVIGYFTSEIGTKQALIFDPVPGPYQGCIPFDDVGGVYAL